MEAMVRRPALRYYGGKWELAPWIIAHLPPHRIYVEPYCGAASVLLRKPRAYAEVLNDLDGEVVNLFRVLRDREQAAELVRLLRLTPYAHAELDASYGPVAADPVERARQTIVRAFMGFGADAVTMRCRTGFRANSNRSGTTPAHDWANYPDALAAMCERLQGVVIENKDALAVMRQHDGAETLHYVDPPYLHSTRTRSRTHGYRHEMADEQHAGLAEVLHASRGMVVLSGYPSELYQDLYGDWERIETPAQADGARPRTEVLWLSPAASTALYRARGGKQLSLLPTP